MKNAKILIIDDELGVRNSLKGILEDESFIVKDFEKGEDGVRAFQREGYDLILLDVWLPGKDGLEILKKVKEIDENCPVIMISAHGTIETAVKATKLGAYDFLEKPLSSEKVILTINNALKQKKLEEEVSLLRDKIKAKYVLVGESKAIKKLKELIDYVAPTNGRVLIAGENGTGKELVARLIHEKSHRKDRNFAEINCAAIPEDLIESELFGYVKGAFTNALKDKKGKFLLSDGGTLFLDEIGDMSLKTQAKVLRVIEEQKFEPLGSTEQIFIDTRIIAATNKNLEEEIKKGSFREDLYFRINVIPICVPPLRERKEDIPLLSEYFLDLFYKEYGREKKILTSEAIDILMNYNWPGNVRELKNLIERLVIMVRETKITEKEILLPERKSEYSERVDFLSLQEAKDFYEKEFILRKLKENGWNISKTAEILKMERSSLYKKMKAYGISIER
ncbi:MAG: sigma-54 dependent transcriptional regulator [Acidobacteriota bacterium]